MDTFANALRQKVWTAIVLLIGSWIPWLISKFATDAFKQTVRGFAQSSAVTAGMYNLMALAAQNPISASLLAVLLVVCGAAIYSAVEVKRHAQSSSEARQVTDGGSERPSYESLLGSARHWESRCNVMEVQ